MGTSNGLNHFSTKLLVVAKNVNLETSAIMRKAVLVTGQALVSITPVDTGRAQGAWVASVDSDDKSINPDIVDPNSAVAKIATNIAPYNTSINSTIYLNNNLPYIEALNNGHSQKAPAGFVEQSIVVGINAVKLSKVIGLK